MSDTQPDAAPTPYDYVTINVMEHQAIVQKIARLERSEFELRMQIGKLAKKVRDADILLVQVRRHDLTDQFFDQVEKWLKED